MIHRILLCGLAAALPAAAPAAESQPIAAGAFGVREAAWSVDISPKGDKIVYITAAPGAASAVLVSDLSGGAPRLLTGSNGNPERVQWCNFASEDQLVCAVSAMVQDVGGLVPFRRLFAIAEGGKPRLLGQRQTDYSLGINQYDGEIIDWLPDENGAVLMSRSYVPESRTDTRLIQRNEGLGVDRIDLKTLKISRVEVPNRLASSFVSDGRGHVRIMSVDEARGAERMLTGKTKYYYRKTGSSEWLPFSEVVSGEGLVPIAVDATADVAYALKKLNGRNALYRVKLDDSLASELVFAHDRVDVEDVVRVGKGAKVIGVTFVEDDRKVVYFDPEFKALASKLSKALPALPLVTFLGSSADNQKLLIFAGSDSDPGRYYVYDKPTHGLRELMLARPALEGMKLASVKPISYPVGDVSIPGYLTVPPGVEAKRLPAIILPHGGPSSRDEWGFDWLAQFLASRGYVVLQPNYRGSDGYGDEWRNENGFRGWRTSIGDITAGARWLVAQGVADPDQLSILGWSYGGYAALQAAVVEPNLFKAVVAVAPVTDFELLKQQWQGYTNARMVAQLVGNGPLLREGSPLQNVDKIVAPVLMFHGDRDLNVSIEHSRKMDRALHSAGRKSELIEYPGLEHDLADSEVRTRMLEKIAAFLSESGAK